MVTALLSHFSVPPQKPIIHDSNGHRVTSNLGPLREGEALEATCTTSGGEREKKKEAKCNVALAIKHASQWTLKLLL